MIESGATVSTVQIVLMIIGGLGVVVMALATGVARFAVTTYRDGKKAQSEGVASMVKAQSDMFSSMLKSQGDLFMSMFKGVDERVIANGKELKELRDDKQHDHDLLWYESKKVLSTVKDVSDEVIRITQADKDKDGRLTRIEQEMKEMRTEMNLKMDKLLSRSPNGN